jgi:arylsulfatase A-like enzyme
VQPNILLIHSDQHRYDCVGAHGHPQLKTPHLDQLCREGVDFSHAFTPSPICTPARASLLTGRWPTQHGALNIPPTEINRSIAPGSVIFWDLLRSTGYKQALVGKWHNETPQPPTAYIDDYIPEDAGYDAWRAEQGIPRRVRKNEWFGEIDPPITSEQHRIAWEARHVQRLLTEYNASGKPWMIRWDPSEPHLPNMIPPDIADLYPPESITPWPSFPDSLAGKPGIQMQQRRTWGIDQWTWKDHWAPMVSRYLAEITLLDRYIGNVLSTLRELGQANNTLVIYSTDHGDYCGGHGQVDKHYNMYDDVLRVPLIMRMPGYLPAGRVCDEFVTHEIDLATTIVNFATGSVPTSFTGVDLLPVARGEKGTDRTDIYAQYFGSQFGLYSQRMLRDRRWKYVYNATEIDELYDTQSDPGELTNLAQKPELQGELMRLRGRLLKWMESVRDPLLNYFTRPQLEKPGVKV